MPKVQVRRGSKANLPVLSPGEFGLVTDGDELYIGNERNLQIPILGEDGKLPSRYLNPAGSVVDAIYPVGAIYLSFNNVNPESFLGGVWEGFGAGRTLIGVDVNDTEFSASGKEGGAKAVDLSHTHTVDSHSHTGASHTHTIASHTHAGPSHSHTTSSHTLTSSEIPSHTHSASTGSGGSHTHSISSLMTPRSSFGGSSSRYTKGTGDGSDWILYGTDRETNSGGSHSHTVTVGSTGGGNSHSHGNTGTASGTTGGTSLTTAAGGSGETGTSAPKTDPQLGSQSVVQPYVTCYMWKRVA